MSKHLQEMTGVEMMTMGTFKTSETLVKSTTTIMPALTFLTGWMPFLLPSQRCLSIDGIVNTRKPERFE